MVPVAAVLAYPGTLVGDCDTPQTGAGIISITPYARQKNRFRK